MQYALNLVDPRCIIWVREVRDPSLGARGITHLRHGKPLRSLRNSLRSLREKKMHLHPFFG